MDEGFAVLRRCRALTGSAGDSEAGILIDIYESDALLKTARFADAADVARRGLRDARQAGLEDFWNSAILTANAAEALVAQGRTAEAGALVDPLTEETPDRRSLAGAPVPRRDRPAARRHRGRAAAAAADPRSHRPRRELRPVP